jgi:hypothetical protein
MEKVRNPEPSRRANVVAVAKVRSSGVLERRVPGMGPKSGRRP